MRLWTTLFLAAFGACCIVPTDSPRADGGAAPLKPGVEAALAARARRGLPMAQHPALLDRGVAAASRPPQEVGPAGAGALRAPARWGARTQGGPAGVQDPRVDLSAAHALVREFSVDSAFGTSDTALAAALAHDESLTPAGLYPALDRYASQLSDVQVVHAGPAELGPAEVRMVGSVAVIRPGHGDVALPAETQVVAVDLRELPSVDELKTILPRMVAPAMKEPVATLSRVVRTHFGPVDEVFSPFNVYSTGVGIEQEPALTGTGARDLPIVLLTGQRLASQAAAFAAAMRSARRAWIAGESVPLPVAESSWRGVGDRGVAVRTSLLASATALPTEVFVNQIARQDNQSDPTTASYRRDFTINGTDTVSLDIAIDGPDNGDIDLFLLRDFDGNGVFDLFGGELVAASSTENPDEAVRLTSVEPGRYQVWVWGWFVPGGQIPFTLSMRRTVAVPLPDEIPADMPPALGELAGRVLGATPPPVAGPAERTSPAVLSPFGARHPVSNGRGELRAGVLIAHGVLRLFFRYFDEVGDTIDERLLETLEAADAHDGADRIAFWRILRRFGEAIHDGHQFVFSSVPLADTRLPVQLEHIGGRPVVRRSGVPGIQPGDTIVALEGRPIEQVYAEELARTSAATPGYQRDIADRYVFMMSGPLSLTLESPDGARRTVTAPLQPQSVYVDVITRGVSDRPSGPLADLGAPNLYYLNLNTFTTPSDAAMRAAIAEASALGSTAMVLDMRGYPGGTNHYEVAQRLIRQPFWSPVFEAASYSGPEHQGLLTDQFPIFPLGAPAFSRPIVLLTGPHAVSAAENFMQMLVGANRLRAVVGQRSAGTNGNITGVQLPGGFEFTYTGMEVRNPNGSRHHGVGIVPSVAVPLTVPDLRDGIDRDLLTAIGLLQ